jgi:enoyl-CoA hydratase/carnithine racemase
LQKEGSNEHGKEPGMSAETYETISYEIGGQNNGICRITLNRPDKYNAIDRQMAKELVEAFRKVREVPSVGVVVLSGAGKSFCTGGDLSVFPSLAEHQNAMNWLAHEGLDVQKSITGCEKVVIGRIHGYCLAGGLELALCCDLLYASASAKMGTTEINMGILPGWGGTARLPRSMPIYRAREMVYSGRKDYTAGEMYEMGMLTRVFKDEEFEEKFEEMVGIIGSKSPIALRMGKEVMERSAEGGSIDTALAVERNAIQWLQNSPAIQAALDIYREKPDQFTQKQKESNIEADVKK